MLRKEYTEAKENFLPTKLLHLTIHDAVLHAFEDSKQKQSTNVSNFINYSTNVRGGYLMNNRNMYPMINSNAFGIKTRRVHRVNNLTRYY